MKDSFGSAKDGKKNIIWGLLFVVIAALSVYAVTSISRGYSAMELLRAIRRSNPVFVALAVLCMIGYIFFEGAALRVLVKSFGHRCSLKDSIVFSASDIYFSAITPSATGGQPACAYFMINSGIPSSCVTVSLVFNVALYTLSIIIIGIICVAIAPGVFLFFRPVTRIIIVLGAITLVGLASVFVLFILKRSFIEKAGGIIIGIGCRLRIIRDRFAWNKKLEKWSSEYMQYADQIWTHKKAITKALLLNVLQRACQLAVTMFMYIAVNINGFRGPIKELIFNGGRLFSVQGLISIGATYIPVPGAMGFTDLMMLDGFSAIMPESHAAALELMSRSISFYACVIICFVIVAVAFIKRKKNET